MGLLDLFGKKSMPDTALYDITAEAHPFRLPAHKNDSVDLEIALENICDKELLTSVVVVAQKPLSLDQTGLSQQREVRLGPMQSGERKALKVPVYSTPRTEPGVYSLKVFAISHYRDYGHVLNEVRKVLSLRVA